MASSTIDESVSIEAEIRRSRVVYSRHHRPTEAVIVLHQLCLRFNHLQEDGVSHDVLLEDVVGIEVVEKVQGEIDQSHKCRLVIYEFASAKPEKRPRGRRNLARFAVDFSENEEFEKNLESARGWKEAILNQCSEAVKATFDYADNKNCVLIFKNSENHQSIYIRYCVQLRPTQTASLSGSHKPSSR